MTNDKDSPHNIFNLLSKPENILLLLASVFGLLFVFVTPPALVGDEPNHFFRAYQISDGIIIGEKRDNLSGGWLPKSVLYTNQKLVGNIEMNRDVKFDKNHFSVMIRLPLNREDKVFERFPNTVIYNPIPYAPQVFGIVVGKIFDASPLLMIYLARIFNLLFFTVLAWYAIKKTPVHKWVFCLLCLTPTNVFQVASASIDAFTYGICFLTIAYFLYYAFVENSELKNVDVIKLFVLSLLAVLSKNAYVFLPLLFLLIPRRKFRSTQTFLTTFFILFIASVGSVIAWSYAIKSIYLPYRIDMPMSPEEQAAFILSQPFNFIRIVVTDYIFNFRFYFNSFFGQLTWLDLYVPTALPVFIFVVLMFVALLDKNLIVNVTKSSKFIFAAVIVGTAFVISALLYMSWSPIRGDVIEGIQGRYFIPVAPLFFLLFYNKKLKWKNFNRYADKIVYITVIVSLIITLHSIVKRYYL